MSEKDEKEKRAGETEDEMGEAGADVTCGDTSAISCIDQSMMPEFKAFIKACLEAQRAYSALALASLDEKGHAKAVEQFKKDFPMIEKAERNLDGIRNVATVGAIFNSIPEYYFQGFTIFLCGLKHAFGNDFVAALDDQIEADPEGNGGKGNEA